MRIWGIRHRVLLLTVAPALAIALLLGGYFITAQVSALEQSLRERGHAIAHSLAPAAEYGVFSGNRAVLQGLARAAAAESNVRSIAITDAAGNVLASAGPPLFPLGRAPNATPVASVPWRADDAALVFEAPIRSSRVAIEDYLDASGGGRSTLGSVYVELSLDTLVVRRNEILLRGLAITLCLLLATAALAHRLGRRVSEPILNLTETAGRIGRGELDARARTDADGELRLLAERVNAMAGSLQQSRERLEERVRQATAELRTALAALAAQNREISQAREEAERVSRIKSEFVANVSHELRTPLNGVLGFLELLGQTPLDDAQRDYTRTMQASARQLLSLINDLLDFSKIEAGRLSLEHAPFSLRQMVTGATAALGAAARAKGLGFAVQIAADVPDRLVGDPLRVTQVLTNLVSNAVKFTTAGEIHVGAENAGAAASGAEILFSVKDTGIGLSAAQQAQLFRAFAQADSSITRRYGGTGLGLAISKRLVELMHGAIGLESRPGEGALFWFRLPLEIEAAVAEKRSEASTPAPPASARVRVLLVDDNEINRKLVATMLANLGALAVAVESGAQALAECRHDDFDVILMDIHMPDMDGTEATRRIRALAGRNAQTPIIALTANAMAGDREHYLAEGMNDYLAKPLTQKSLHEILSRWASGSALAARPSPPILAAPPAAGREPPALDQSLGLELSGGDAGVWRHALGILLEELPGQLDRIARALADRDFETVREVSHRLACSAAYCGTVPLHQAALALESASAAGNADRTAPLAERLQIEASRLFTASLGI